MQPRRVLEEGSELEGLASEEAAARLARYGPNAIPEGRPRLIRAFLSKLWAPVPWMLEAAIVLEVFLHEAMEAVVFGALLVFNAILGFAQERRAQQALQLLRHRLEIRARVLRDGRWSLAPAEELVPGDVVHLRMGDVVPADMRLSSGDLQVDQSSLTGESLPVGAGPDSTVYSGSVVSRGEATGLVVATGTSTFFGRTAELVRTAEPPSQLAQIIYGIVRYLVAIDIVLVVALLGYSLFRGVDPVRITSFALILLIASVPVALPATFTLATALGAQELAGRGVLVTRLAAIEEAAAMDVLCSDKTGTITENRLAVADVRPVAPHSGGELLRMATLASDEATQDPIDLAILAAAGGDREAGGDGTADGEVPVRSRFVPFDPATKRSEALVRIGGHEVRVAKGAPQVIEGLVGQDGDAFAREVEELSGRGDRVIAVAAGADGGMELIGLIGLHDPVRSDSKDLVGRLKSLGVRVIMVTGDGLATAQAVATEVGLEARARTAEWLRGGRAGRALDFDVVAEVLPEDKLNLVRELQQDGHVVGMTGDGVNDAPALKQAQVGTAVSNATDVAKASASLVLTDPGLTDIVDGVQTSRQIYQRMLTYTLNKIIKTFQIAMFLSVGFLLTGTFVTTPRLVVLLLFANDFVTMSIAADRVSFSRAPDRWPVRAMVTSALGLAVPLLLLSFGVWWAARDVFHLAPRQIQTVVFLWLVLSGQATVYLVRERGRFWSSVPGRWILVSSAADLVVVTLLATRGWLMAAVPVGVAAWLLLPVAVYLLGSEAIKGTVLRRSGLVSSARAPT